jgi:hypothetical protein
MEHKFMWWKWRCSFIFQCDVKKGGRGRQSGLLLPALPGYNTESGQGKIAGNMPLKSRLFGSGTIICRNMSTFWSYSCCKPNRSGSGSVFPGRWRL